MRLTLREAAASLDCTEKTVLRWIAHAGLPTVRLGGLYHFNRAELLEWALHHGMGPTALARELEPEADGQARETVSALAGAMRAGGVMRGICANTLPELLCPVVGHMIPDAPEHQRELVLAMLLAREATGITAVGGGVLAPHVRAPLILGETPRIVLVYPARPLPLSAVPTPDNAPIEAVFVLASPTVRAHLTLLALLAAALRDADFRQAVLSRASEAALLTAAAAAEHAHDSAAARRGRRQ
ncbi:PTS IIA-like nitrogen-regulatory protein PtsN [Humidesulfovibrio mexicanus]|uniref:PTS IIA-like nitrogen-regulatory protein PtsN n=1 Tax=Humidesulfovibrio mexicanus TaxID=147047 RepID=A0A239A9Y4_9BACT|nr:PTS sugar transporter subunit IIA [Humidesulfovibrio mexicanus]SNR92141.1 PTS IIA-like nitrogen-regulatory protein PtsN [Humidesulfovibrio mexicanus]